jgi:hypothetical protein
MKHMFEDASRIVEHEIDGVDELSNQLTPQQQQKIVIKLADHFIYLMRECLMPDAEANVAPKMPSSMTTGKKLAGAIIQQVIEEARVGERKGPPEEG